MERLPHNAPMMMNATCEKLFEILSDGITDQICINADELASSVDLDDGQELTWLASSFIDGALVNIFFCEVDGEDEQFINTQHSDGGQLIGFTGPFLSYAEAKRYAGPAPEGWTEV
jgi:hypothetical protein